MVCICLTHLKRERSWTTSEPRMPILNCVENYFVYSVVKLHFLNGSRAKAEMTFLLIFPMYIKNKQLLKANFRFLELFKVQGGGMRGEST